MNENQSKPLGGSPADRNGPSPDESTTPAMDAVAGTSGAQTEDRHENTAPQGAGPAEPLSTATPPQRLEPVYDGDLKRQYEDVVGDLSIDQQRENVREWLAKSLIRILTWSLFLGFVLIITRRWTHVSAEDTRTYFQVVFTAVIALVSAATGFYFGASAHGNNNSRREG